MISVITPTFNEEKNIKACIDSIFLQDYPKKLIEIIVIDDNSTDETVRIAKSLGAQVFVSGFKHIEKSKSIGLSKASGEFILFMDADLRLDSKSWIRDFVESLIENPKAVGAQAIYWKYSKSHNIYDRYCELFGVNDPFVFMLGKRGVLSPIEKKWLKNGRLINETRDYFFVKFDKNNLPTMGSQGYIARKDLIISQTSWEPYFFHLDSIYELVEKGRDQFLLMKSSVEHKYVSNFRDFHKKLYRNLILFLKYRKYRKYDYGVNSFKFFTTLVLMVTVVYPLFISVRNFIKKPDIAWFLHPIFCVTVPALYACVFVKNKILK